MRLNLKIGRLSYIGWFVIAITCLTTAQLLLAQQAALIVMIACIAAMFGLVVLRIISAESNCAILMICVTFFGLITFPGWAILGIPIVLAIVPTAKPGMGLFDKTQPADES